MIHAYNNAGLMSPGVVNTITRVMNGCKICQKFQKPTKSNFAKVNGFLPGGNDGFKKHGEEVYIVDYL